MVRKDREGIIEIMNNELVDTKEKVDILSGIPLIITTVSLLSIVLTGMFYWWDKVYLRFFGISVCNIEINLASRVTELLLACLIIVPMVNMDVLNSRKSALDICMKMFKSIIVAIFLRAMPIETTAKCGIEFLVVGAYYIMTTGESLLLSVRKHVKWIPKKKKNLSKKNRISGRLIFAHAVTLCFLISVPMNIAANKMIILKTDFAVVTNEDVVIVYETKDRYFCLKIIQEDKGVITVDKSAYTIVDKVGLEVMYRTFEEVRYVG